MLTVVKWLGVTAAVIVIAVAAAIAVIGWEWAKPYVAGRISDAIGRESTIEDIDLVELSLRPRIRLKGVRLVNAAWSDEPYMLKAGRVALNIDLLALLRGGMVLSEVEFEQPRLFLAVSRNGKPNWAFITKPASHGEPTIPVVEHWQIDDGRVIYQDLRGDTSLRGTVAKAQGAIAGTERHASFHGNGQLEGRPWRLNADLGSLLDRDREPKASEIHARITLGKTRVEIDGSIARPLNEFEVDFTLAGPGPAQLEQVAPIALPHLPPYRFEGRLERDGDSWSIQDLAGSIGVSDVSGDLSLTTAGERMFLRAKLASDKLDFVQIFGPAQPVGSGPVIPDTAIDVSPLPGLDAEISYRATRIYAPRRTFEHFSTELLLNEGHLTLAPLTFDYLGGTFDGRIEVAVNEKPIHTSLDVKLHKLSLNEILAKANVADQATGIISGRVSLTGNGRSPADFAASADGSVWLVMRDGRINKLLIEKAGLGLIESLSLIDDEGSDPVSTCTVDGPWCAEGGEQAEPTEQDDPNERNESDSVSVRCLIADFRAHNGVLTTQTLIIDTADTKVVGGGTIALGSESVDLTLWPHAKDFSLLAGQAPLHIRGGFRNLHVEVSKARIAFSLLTPIELGTVDAANCRQLIQAVRRQ